MEKYVKNFSFFFFFAWVEKINPLVVQLLGSSSLVAFNSAEFLFMNTRLLTTIPCIVCRKASDIITQFQNLCFYCFSFFSLGLFFFSTTQ